MLKQSILFTCWADKHLICILELEIWCTKYLMQKQSCEMATDSISNYSSCRHIFSSTDCLDPTCDIPYLMVSILLFLTMTYVSIVSPSKAWYGQMNFFLTTRSISEILLKLPTLLCQYSSYNLSYPYWLLLLSDSVCHI